MSDRDIDGLLEDLDRDEGGNDGGELQTEHRGEKKEKKDKKDKKKRREQDMEMGQISYTPEVAPAAASTYQSGLSGSGYGGGGINYGASGNPSSGYVAQHQGAYDSAGQAPLPRREFSMCGPGTQDLIINMCLLLSFCAFEAVFSMISDSVLLMVDFFRRLGGVFAMVYTLEVCQASYETEVVDGRTVSIAALPDINASTSPQERLAKVDNAALELRGADRRRLYIASLMIGTYLLAVSFISAMAAIVSMYGGAPDKVSKAGWIMVIGGLCLLLDLVHLRYDVQVNLGTNTEDDSNIWTRVWGCSYGSLFVIFGAFLQLVADSNAYIDPILIIFFAGTIAALSSDSVMKNASALMYKAWHEM